MINLALLVLRVTVGGLMAGHGAQKLFGSFGGYGVQGTGGWLESMGLRPGRPWAYAAGLSEFGGGMLTLLGALNPLGPVGIISSMAMATAKVHWGKPIWVTAGGAELPVVNAAAATVIIIAGSGDYSVDRALGVRLPKWVALPALGVAAGVMAFGLRGSQGQQEAPEEVAGGELIGGQEAEHPA